MIGRPLALGADDDSNVVCPDDSSGRGTSTRPKAQGAAGRSRAQGAGRSRAQQGAAGRRAQQGAGRRAQGEYLAIGTILNASQSVPF